MVAVCGMPRIGWRWMRMLRIIEHNTGTFQTNATPPRHACLRSISSAAFVDAILPLQRTLTDLFHFSSSRKYLSERCLIPVISLPA